MLIAFYRKSSTGERTWPYFFILFHGAFSWPRLRLELPRPRGFHQLHTLGQAATAKPRVPGPPVPACRCRGNFPASSDAHLRGGTPLLASFPGAPAPPRKVRVSAPLLVRPGPQPRLSRVVPLLPTVDAHIPVSAEGRAQGTRRRPGRPRTHAAGTREGGWLLPPAAAQRPPGAVLALEAHGSPL